jgi:hypothetical protein
MELDHTQKYICKYRISPQNSAKSLEDQLEFDIFFTKSAFDEFTSIRFKFTSIRLKKFFLSNAFAELKKSIPGEMVNLQKSTYQKVSPYIS